MRNHRLILAVLIAFASIMTGYAITTLTKPERSEPVLAATHGGYELTLARYLGGAVSDTARDVSTDSAGNIYVTGGTESADFPTTPGAYDRTHNGMTDIFVVKLNPQGEVVWSTLIGGPKNDRAYALEVDGQGFIYLAGRAGPGLPVTAGSFQPTYQGYDTGNPYGEQNAFVMKLRPDGAGFEWSSYFGTGPMIRDIAIDGAGNAYVYAEYLQALSSAAPPAAWFASSFQRTAPGGSDAIVAKIASDGSRVDWANYLGGSGHEGGEGAIRVDGSGSAYVAVVSGSADAPTTAGALSRTLKGSSDIYVARFTPDGTGLVFATFLGGSGGEDTETHQLALDPAGNAIVTGVTLSADFPTTPGAFQTTYGGPGGPDTGAQSNYSGDAIVAKLSADGTRLVASTFVGGRFGEGGEGIAVDPAGDVYLTGGTYSDNFPVTADAAQSTRNGPLDAIAVKLSADLSQVLYSTYLGGSGADVGRAAHVDPAGVFYIVGETASTDWPQRGVPSASAPGPTDGVLARFTPLATTPTPPTATSTPSEATPTSPAATATPPATTVTPFNYLPAILE